MYFSTLSNDLWKLKYWKLKTAKEKLISRGKNKVYIYAYWFFEYVAGNFWNIMIWGMLGKYELSNRRDVSTLLDTILWSLYIIMMLDVLVCELTTNLRSHNTSQLLLMVYRSIVLYIFFVLERSSTIQGFGPDPVYMICSYLWQSLFITFAHFLICSITGIDFTFPLLII